MRTLLVCLVLVTGLVWIVRNTGCMLVIDCPQRADAIVVLEGDRDDVRYWRGRELLRAGYAPILLLDSSSDKSMYGRKLTDLAAQFVQSTAGESRGHALVCPIAEDSTVSETKYVRRCLEQQGARSVLLVTSDYHTRRAYSIFSHRLPQYQWSVAAAQDKKVFGEKWWLNREWAKTSLMEYQRLLWWELVERWRANNDLSGFRRTVEGNCDYLVDAEQGEPDAQFALASAYAEGDRVETAFGSVLILLREIEVSSQSAR